MITVHAQAQQASRDGFVRHVVFSHLSGLLVMSQAQAKAFRNLVVVDATYRSGAIVLKAVTQ